MVACITAEFPPYRLYFTWVYVLYPNDDTDLVAVKFGARWIFCFGSISPILDTISSVLGGIIRQPGITGNKKFQVDQRAAAPGTVLPRIFTLAA